MSYTGAPNSLLNIACLLRSKNFNVKVATLTRGIFEKEFFKRRFFVHHINPVNFDYNILSEKYDLVICNTIFCGEFALKAQKFVRTILYIREAQNLPEIMTNMKMSDDCINNAEHIICVSEYAEDFIRKNYHPADLNVIHNFISFDEDFSPAENKADDKVHFFIAGTVEKRKCQDVALKAMELLPENFSDKAVLHIAGKMPVWSKDYWEKLDITGRKNVIYHGVIASRKKMHDFYNSVNVVIVPSLDESCSLTALEGALHGRALILSENVGAKYIVDSNGLIVKTSSAEALAHAFEYMIENHNELDRFGKRSYENFISTSTPEIYYKNFCKVIDKITDNDL